MDFAWVFEGWEVIDGKLRGLDLTYLPLTAYKQAIPDYYTPVFITNEEMTQKNGDLVNKFLAATSKGYNDAIADPKGTGDILAKATPETSKELNPAKPDIPRQAVQSRRATLGRSEADSLANLWRLHDRSKTAC